MAPRISPKAVSAAADLWAAGMATARMAAELGWTKDAVCALAKRRRDLFPERARGGNRQVKQPAKPAAKPKVQAAPVETPAAVEPKVQPADRAMTAFRPLTGSMPAPISDLSASGCRWPVHAEGNPLTTRAVLFCGCTREPGRPYCATHAEMSRGAGTIGERRAAAVLRHVAAVEVSGSGMAA